MNRRDFCLLTLTAPLGLSASFGERVLTVAADGSGQFTRVQAAVDAIPAGNRERVVLQIRPGTYKERIVVPVEKPFVTFRGTDNDAAPRTVLTFDNFAVKPGPDGKPLGTSGSASVYVYADNFAAENITFANTAGRSSSQAVALRASGDRCAFRNCRFNGWQDTLYATGPGRQYFRDCFIEGHVDFIFGTAAAVFENCRIHSKAPGYIAAHYRTSPYQTSGYVFRNCELTGDTEAGTVYLGRPWRPHSRVVYVGCAMGAQIRPEGWDNWRDPKNEATAWFAECNSRGAGANPAKRVAWSRQLTAYEAGPFETRRFFERGSGDNWVPPFLEADTKT